MSITDRLARIESQVREDNDVLAQKVAQLRQEAELCRQRGRDLDAQADMMQAHIDKWKALIEDTAADGVNAG